ncbi:signal peptidase II [Sphaerisporangium fuscum]|uniref:signal peptidase II n=1 Tax=Sphaerisporangium fuscum TaxID=2835868 RepID=UPI0027E2CCC1|nr:signal peptidase II [Sphaerisporangium fuscum]
MQAAGGAPLTPPPDAAGGRAAARARRLGILAVVAVLVYVLDLVSKTLVVKLLEGGEPVTVIPEVLRLQVIRNSGAAFSMGTGMTVVFTVIAAGVVVAILRTARKLRSAPWAITLGLLLGGALGNLTDRLFRYPAPLRGHVVDWIEAFPATHFPIFNLADSGIVCGGVLAVFLAWRGYQIDGTRAGDGEREAAAPAEASSSGTEGEGERHG